ncbi:MULTISPECIES: formyltransferase [unclassified Undibacterium]|uniref:formyltransferase n=1 Tax=unclassified Undibacterium TaxID=2630295 RepID=UPI002AC9B5A4|nr:MULTISPECIES: formyltransferase [unclassified Undibacterium]MEB0139672.1 formyltransferase [Undibacterium sp. CCC2.1]MEB0172553.1 formyltransferase [Undibacterium sp. CCC1.1]MEB0176351.1 formyltransferase [Undibacterium sp. CCC3.4]MEB0215685.1 formyltransferase [Undibacterium sp. 5I2]WPX42963.1 formyltransferase [Undibacterium sp. CCC3.4]
MNHKASDPVPSRAVVFAYHNVGVRSIKTLLARGITISLVVTHEDNPAETIWFDSVAALCAEHGIACIAPADPSTPAVHEQIAALQPEFIFSFYYRHMLPAALLALATRGAFNLHGSLLPKYRGRVPVNWAVLHGETETGATLHEMAAKPDAGAIIAQTMVPILPDDTAYEVFGKLTVAAEQTLWHAVPELIAGTVKRHPNLLSAGSYFGGRKPEDGRIDWNQPAQAVYNLHRAVAPPYPGAFFEQFGKHFIIEKARLSNLPATDLPMGLHVVDNVILGICGDGHAIQIIALRCDDALVTATELQQLAH